jgi:hypothetical protein
MTVTATAVVMGREGIIKHVIGGIEEEKPSW